MMKKGMITIIVLMMYVTTFGQQHYVGWKGGISQTDMYSKLFIKGMKYRTGFSTGITYEHQLDNKILLGADLLYSQKGSLVPIIYTTPQGDPTGEGDLTDYRYDYISLPLKAGYAFGNRFSGYINVGIVPSYLIYAIATLPASAQVEERYLKMTKAVTHFDVGALAEIGASYALNNHFIVSTSFTYQQDFLTLTNDDYYRSSVLKHYGMSFSVGLKYALVVE